MEMRSKRTISAMNAAMAFAMIAGASSGYGPTVYRNVDRPKRRDPEPEPVAKPEHSDQLLTSADYLRLGQAAEKRSRKAARQAKGMNNG